MDTLEKSKRSLNQELTIKIINLKTREQALYEIILDPQKNIDKSDAIAKFQIIYGKREIKIKINEKNLICKNVKVLDFYKLISQSNFNISRLNNDTTHSQIVKSIVTIAWKNQINIQSLYKGLLSNFEMEFYQIHKTGKELNLYFNQNIDEIKMKRMLYSLFPSRRDPKANEKGSIIITSIRHFPHRNWIMETFSLNSNNSKFQGERSIYTHLTLEGSKGPFRFYSNPKDPLNTMANMKKLKLYLLENEDEHTTKKTLLSRVIFNSSFNDDSYSFSMIIYPYRENPFLLVVFHFWGSLEMFNEFSLKIKKIFHILIIDPPNYNNSNNNNNNNGNGDGDEVLPILYKKLSIKNNILKSRLVLVKKFLCKRIPLMTRNHLGSYLRVLSRLVKDPSSIEMDSWVIKFNKGNSIDPISLFRRIYDALGSEKSTLRLGLLTLYETNTFLIFIDHSHDAAILEKMGRFLVEISSKEFMFKTFKRTRFDRLEFQLDLFLNFF